MNYLILGRGANTGDIGIACALLQDVLRIDPDARIVTLCDRPETYSQLAELEGQTVGVFADISSGASTRWLRRISRQAEFLFRLAALRYWPDLLCRREPTLREITKHVAGADVLVRQGGPGWNDWVLNGKILRIRLAYFALAGHYGVPWVMYAQSYGPFAWPGLTGRVKRALVRHMLNGSRLLTLRDRYSRAALDRIEVTQPEIVDAADAAWNLRPAPAAEARRHFARWGVSDDGRPRIGLTLRSLHGRYGVPEAREQELISEFARFCDNVIEEHGTLVFLSTDYRQHGRRNDLDVLRLVQKQMRHASKVNVIEEEMLPALLKAMYAQMDVLVSVRLHPGIFAMASGVPTLLIGYDPKCADVAEQMQMQDWHIDIQNFTAEAGTQKLRAMLERRTELTSTTQRHADEIKSRASASAQALKVLRSQIQPQAAEPDEPVGAAT